jgi:lipoyl(octanoyl) transferase
MKKYPTIFQDLQTFEYKDAWEYQESLLQNIIDEKNKNIKPTKQHLLFCEHPHVYTLGKSGSENNLLINDEFLKKINATYHKSNRGGDITYHGPGQIVGYPIFNLQQMNILLKKYIYKLEEAIIQTIAEYNIEGERLEGATGVWLDSNKKNKARKICAMGVRVSRWVSMHGFALNVNTNLDYFKHINPCGFTDKTVSSIEKELGQKIDIEDVKHILKEKLTQEFNLQLIS